MQLFWSSVRVVVMATGYGLGDRGLRRPVPVGSTLLTPAMSQNVTIHSYPHSSHGVAFSEAKEQLYLSPLWRL
jgi:hypothetical protein